MAEWESVSSIIIDRPPAPELDKRWRIAKAAFVIVLVYVIGYHAWLYATAEGRVGAICADITRGSSRTDIQAFARAHDFRVPDSTGTTTFMGEKATNGRYGCRIEWEGDVVVRATYSSRQ